MTHDTHTTAARWHRLADELTHHADEAMGKRGMPDEVRERVGLLLVREALALRASSRWPERGGEGEATGGLGSSLAVRGGAGDGLAQNHSLTKSKTNIPFSKCLIHKD